MSLGHGSHHVIYTDQRNSRPTSSHNRICTVVCQTCQLSRVTRESHGFLHFLQSHGRGNSCSRVYSCPTVLFSHRLLPIIIAGNTFWQHKFSVNETEACFLRPGSSVARPKRRSALSCLDGRFEASSAVFFPNL